MPELPEVETVRRGLENQIIGRKILKVKVNRAKTIEGLEPSEFESKLAGQKFKVIKRRAKYLFFELESGEVISAHLKMSGAFLVHPANLEAPKHTHVVFELDDGRELRFKDLRAFGRLSLYGSIDEAYQIGSIPNLAPEPFEPEFTLEHFEKSLKKFSSPIKVVLLDQSKAVSGVGNIYADESLFLSGIRPQKSANTLSKAQVKKLYDAVKKVIGDSIEAGGTTVRDYVNANGSFGEYALKLFVYGQKKGNCKICKTAIEYIRLGQRGTHYCPKCQEE